MKAKDLGIRMDPKTGQIFLTEEKLRQPIKRLADITAPVLLSLCADLNSERDTHFVGRDVKFNDNKSVRILIYDAPINQPEIPERSQWTYKDDLYLVEEVQMDSLIQFNDEWYPTVKYTKYPQTKLVFYRALPDFQAKFVPVYE